jgi:hypothetical protein
LNSLWLLSIAASLLITGSGRISIEWDVLKKKIAPRGKALVPSVQQQATKA